MRQYDAHKDSGIPWVGQIPIHWDIKRAKYLFNKEKRDVRPEDKVVTCFRDGQVTLRENRRTTGFTESITEIGYQGIRKGDLVIHQMDAFAGSIGVSDSDGKGTSVYHCCTPKSDDYYPLYYAFTLREMARSGFIQSLYRGIRERSSDFNFVTFGKQYLPVPPTVEQEKIVAFLDAKTLKIDECICLRERELQTLNELKQSQIASVVTRGLNPNVPMKDSGIPWIGQIPAHWELKRLGTRFHSRTELNSDLEFSKAYKFNYGSIVPKDETGDLSEYADTYIKYTKVLTDDIMINGLNLNYDFVSQRVAIVPSPGIITSAYLVLRPYPSTYSAYFCYLFKAMDAMKLFHGMGTGIRLTLSFDELKKQLIPIPPIEEQKAIVEFIEGKQSKIDSMISSLNAEIERLREYKQSLISDVVTGQINVQDEII